MKKQSKKHIELISNLSKEEKKGVLEKAMIRIERIIDKAENDNLELDFDNKE